MLPFQVRLETRIQANPRRPQGLHLSWLLLAGFITFRVCSKDCLPSTRMIFLGLTYETVVVTLDKLHQTSQLLCYWLSSLRVSKSDISFSTNRHLKRDPFTRDGPNLVLFLKEYTVRRIVEERMKGKVMILERKILTKYKHWAK